MNTPPATAAAIHPVWMEPTAFLSCADVSGTLARGDDRVILCLVCAYNLQESVLVAEPRPAPSDSQCSTCGRFAWGTYTAGEGAATTPGPVLLRPAELAELRLTHRPQPGCTTTSDLALALGELLAVAERQLTELVSSPAGGRDHLRLFYARRAVTSLWQAQGLALRIDRQLADPAPDLLLRLRGMVEAVRAGYGPDAEGDGPYAAELPELNALLDPAARPVA
ncbi:MAG: hypothetical protein WCI67_09035 [Chloroflexales bacterium]